MSRSIPPLVLFLLPALGPVLPATTWDEPWHADVIRRAHTFVLVEVVANPTGHEVKARLVRHLAGRKLPATLTIAGFHSLRIGSTSSAAGDQELRLPFKPKDRVYTFLRKKKDAPTWQLATPTAGWARLADDEVTATYRHSYHKALVDRDLYEKSSTALFLHLHGKPCDRKFVTRFLEEMLGLEPSYFGKGNDSPETRRFFRQHVALELFAHLGRAEDLARLEPFLRARGDHIQISAARALAGLTTGPARKRMEKFLLAKDRIGFAKVMIIRGWRRQEAREMAPVLEKFLAEGEDAKCGFGGSIMDPRVGTRFPSSVKAAARGLLQEWKKGGEERK